jgi:3-oxoacyl-[acyl-carrier protein] reductase
MKVALVTGGSRGLGGGISKALGAAGWIVAVNYAHNKGPAEEVVSEIERNGGRAIAVRFDVTDDEEVRTGLGAIAQKVGPVDLIVNNATAPQMFIKIEDQTWEDHLDQLRFFVKAPLSLLRAVLPDWRRRRTGRVINLGSECFDIGNPNFAHYVGAKGAMLGVTRSWARELGPEGITVNLVEPGWISVQVERQATTTSSEVDEYRSCVPLGKMGRPEDIGAMVVFLASPQADFITGQAFAVNGGRTLS